ncbi:MAG: hypothetical protein ABUT39_29855 [Acidobacteriota bacterium]
MTLALTLLLTIGAGPSLAAPDNNDKKVCADLLRWATVSWETFSDNEKMDIELDFFCSHDFDSSSEARSIMTKAGFVVEGIPMDFGLDADEQKFRESQHDLCRKADRYTLARGRASSVIHALDENVTKAVGDCLRSREGLLGFLEATRNPDTFIVRLRLTNAAVANIDAPIITPRTVISSCQGNLKAGTIQGGTEKVLTCLRNPKVDGVTVVIPSSDHIVDWMTDNSLPVVADPPPASDCTPGQEYIAEDAGTEGNRVVRVAQCTSGYVAAGPGLCNRGLQENDPGTLSRFGHLESGIQLGATMFRCVWSQAQDRGIRLSAQLPCVCKGK